MAGVSDRKMLYLLVVLCVATVKVSGETEIAPDDKKEISKDDEKEISNDDKVQCVKKLVEWCNGMQYPEEGKSGTALVSISYRDDTKFYRVFCSSDSAGSNCSRNGLPWFSCTPDHVLTYKGEVLTETSTTVDNEICKTQEKAFKELLVQNMSYDNSTVSAMETELKSFFKEILEMRQQIYDMTKRLGDASFMGGDFWKGFDNFPFNFSDEDTETVESDEEKKETNQVEKE